MHRFAQSAGVLSHAQPVSRHGPLPRAILGRRSSHNDQPRGAAIQRQLPADLVARVDERVVVEPSEWYPRKIIPDVRVVERVREEPVLRAKSGVAVAEPVVVHMEEDEPAHQGFIEIIDVALGRP